MIITDSGILLAPVYTINSFRRKYDRVDKPRTFLRSHSLFLSLSFSLSYPVTHWHSHSHRNKTNRAPLRALCEFSIHAASTRKRVACNPDKSRLRGARIPADRNYPWLRPGTFPSSFPSQADTRNWDDRTAKRESDAQWCETYDFSNMTMKRFWLYYFIRLLHSYFYMRFRYNYFCLLISSVSNRNIYTWKII